MAENNPAPAAFDYVAFAKANAEATAAAIATALKPLHEQLGKLSAPAPAAVAAAAKGTDTPTPLTMEDVMKGVTEALAKERQANQVSAARDSFVREKMSDLPQTYRDQLPKTGEATELAAAEQRIRAQYRTDFKIANPNAAQPNVTGAGVAGGKPGDVVDLTKLSATQLIEMGVKESTPERQSGIEAAAAAK